MYASRHLRGLLALLGACGAAGVAAALLWTGGTAHASPGHPSSGKPTISRQRWGSVGGKAVYLFTLRSGRGMTVKISNYGGVVQSIWVPARGGGVKNVALGFPTLSDYVKDFTQGATGKPWPLAGGSGDTYFGAIIGRYANRIANHSFTMKCSHCSNNGVTYKLRNNNNGNTLHGGFRGWNTKVWSASAAFGNDAVALKLTYLSPNKDQGFPAPVLATVTYTLTGGNSLRISYRATNRSKSGQATVINLTNHTYFNLAGEGSGPVYGQLLQINASRYQAVNTSLIPVKFASVGGTPFDFRSLKPIGRDIRKASMPDHGGQRFPQLVIAHGYDHNWVLNGSGTRLVAVAQDPGDGIALRTYTDQPGVQLYTGNFLVGDLIGPSGRTYRQSDAFTEETQHYPDTPHHIGQPGWPSVVLLAGHTFTSKTTYAFSK
jgi:aldose 1-epimerase